MKYDNDTRREFYQVSSLVLIQNLIQKEKKMITSKKCYVNNV